MQKLLNFFRNKSDQTAYLQKRIVIINSLEEKISKLSNIELRDKTDEFREFIKNSGRVDDIANEAFAVVREASKRVLKMRHFDVQLIGGFILHEGKISEMRTGEGKTLVATLAAYLNALEGKGVHVVTTNDYLAKRDSEWMGQIYELLGMSVGCITGNLPDEYRKSQYDTDITYGTNNEFAFDFLRDNMKLEKSQMVQRDLHYAIIDEVDSILIDEARTPLIISGMGESSADFYKKINILIPKLSKDDYQVEEKERNVFLTENGISTIEKLLKQAGFIKSDESLYDINNVDLTHYVNQLLKAHFIFKNDVDYIIKDGKVIIIDEFTGRLQDGRRYSDGLHQALEAKENVAIREESQTLASITFQNYFRKYNKISGMTGTAITEEEEFGEIYGLDVVEIPTNKPVVRIDEDDVIYGTKNAKYKAIVSDIENCYKNKQPVLVGTISIEQSEILSKLLKLAKIPHNVLNAKQHEKEALVVAQAGMPSAVTIATNMAGRGTDIVLGGNAELLIKNSPEISEEEIVKINSQIDENRRIVVEAGGLYVLGTERHESRRIDNQLRGRSGRQGDPGKSKFYLSLEDDLLRIFGSDKIGVLLKRIGFNEGEEIKHPWITKSILKAQKKVEERNYDIRKNLLKFDDIINEQRNVIFEQRKDVLNADDISPEIDEMIGEINQELIKNNIIRNELNQTVLDIENLHDEILRIYSINLDLTKYSESINKESQANVLQYINFETKKHIQNKDNEYGEEMIRQIEKRVFLLTLDSLWRNHIRELDNIKYSINLRAYGHKDPFIEYKKESFDLFDELFASLREIVVSRIAHLHISNSEISNITRESQKVVGQLRNMDEKKVKTAKEEFVSILQKRNDDGDASSFPPTTQVISGKIGRNEICKCGSGKKYKNCHGKSE